MAPVKLNKDQKINKAGVEVDVIPIMPSPHMSPDLKKNRKFRRHLSNSPEQHSKVYLQESITKRIFEMNPKRFLSRSSVNEDSPLPNHDEELWMTRSLDDVSNTPNRPIMNAVVGWLSSPTRPTYKSNHKYLTIESHQSSNKPKDVLNENIIKESSSRDISSMEVQRISLIISSLGNFILNCFEK